VCTTPWDFFATSATDGSYDLSAEWVTNLKLYSMHLEVDSGITYIYWGQRNLNACPAAEVDLTTELLSCTAQLTVSVSGQQISWTPNVTVNTLYVTDLLGTGFKWLIISEDGFTSPVSFGVLPSGATEQTAASGTLAPTDLVGVNGRFVDGNTGAQCFNTGSSLPGQ
jgi:hypothetical protein